MINSLKYFILASLLATISYTYTSGEKEPQEIATPELSKDMMLSIMKILSPSDKAVLYLMRYFIDDEIAQKVLIQFIEQYDRKHKHYPARRNYPDLMQAHFSKYSKSNPNFIDTMENALKTLLEKEYCLYYDICQGNIEQFKHHMEQDTTWQMLHSLLQEKAETIVQKLENLTIEGKLLTIEQVLMLLRKYMSRFDKCFMLAGDQMALLEREMVSSPVIESSYPSPHPLALASRFILTGMFLYCCYRLDVIHSPLFQTFQEFLLICNEHMYLVEKLLLLSGGGISFLMFREKPKHTILKEWDHLRNTELDSLWDKLSNTIKVLEQAKKKQQ